MTEVKIPFGRNPDGDMVSVDAVPRGLDCNCVCAECGSPLVARKGEINQHHFAHQIERENCVGARESSIHKFAKGIICEAALDLSLPDQLDLGPVQGVKLEYWLDGIRPDVLVEFDEPVAIEIFVAHRVPTEKIKILAARKLATLEIDLSSYRNADKTEVEWRYLILRTAPRFWIFQPKVVRERIEREAREAAERETARQVEIQRAAERREWIAWRQEQERRDREEWHKLIAAEQQRRKNEDISRREQAALEHQRLLKVEQDKKEQRYLAGLKICANTEWHLAEWERRKAAHREVNR